MQKFEYRTPRYEVDLAVRLEVGGKTFAGRCREISENGACAHFSEQIPAGSHGTLILNYRHLALEVPARVTHAGCTADGLEFLFASEADRRGVEQLVAAIAAAGQHAGPVLVK